MIVYFRKGAIACILLAFTVLHVGTSCNKETRFADTMFDSTLYSADSLSFMVIGDWGTMGSQGQKEVAHQMDTYSGKHNTRFIISTGDNFYPVGVMSTGDVHWKGSFEDVYNKTGHQVPWYAVLGNHDYGASPEAEIKYSLISNRWKMPARYYSLTKQIGNDFSSLFLFTDTSPFVAEYYSRNMADLRKQDTAAQLVWLKQTLGSATENWKIVIGHHPLYSAGSHGNTNELIQRFKPVLLQNKIDVYICGHEHNLQYNRAPGEPVHYLVSGGGGHLSTYVVHPNDHTVFAQASPGFLVMTLYAKAANFYFYNHHGELLYHRQIRK